ncbi:PQQ-dependent sugar dehydrogenase [Streptomyces sp. TRM S81-3]|uniref:PQQ-dependent sugar dehydrogenase n=1 Tax=Streptomyces griseicoloratus TaxID=2752516 RepID=A0A926L7N6_9ACTN|nr:PQQ-dependent sugar dehydrogenase [Streptomyces griseicoloratus]MBD0421593.1 PQQ-dependent sugar dehydrogenase [Streptomyces griseicoloratus]
MSSRRRIRQLVGVLAVTVAVTSCTSGTDGGPSPAASGSAASPSGTEETSVVADGLDAPWSIAFHGDVPLVSERDSARILELGPDGNGRVAGEIDGVLSAEEGGLLGLAVREKHLYAYFTGTGENRIERYPINGRAGSLSLGEGEEILGQIPTASYHNGGRIAFGPDGMLYATVGDAGDDDSAQDLGALSGKILRMTPEGEAPDDNPFPGSLVYSYGHRNPQGIAWADDGTMYASEFGQDTWDELNVIEPGGNYGWPRAEGIAKRDEFVDPVQQWAPAEASPSGIAVVGDALYIANLRGERLREVPLSDPGTATERLVGRHGRLRDVVLSPDGSLWVLTNNTDGRGEPGPDDDRILSLGLDD